MNLYWNPNGADSCSVDLETVRPPVTLYAQGLNAWPDLSR